MQEQGSFAVAVKARATTAMSAKSIFFIIFSVEVSFQFPSASKDGSRRRVSPQARGGGTGGRAVRSGADSSEMRPAEAGQAWGGQIPETTGMSAVVCAGATQETGQRHEGAQSSFAAVAGACS